MHCILSLDNPKENTKQAARRNIQLFIFVRGLHLKVKGKFQNVQKIYQFIRINDEKRI